MEEKKTRHAIWYDNRYGRNDGPPLYYFFNLKRLKNVEVQHLIPGQDAHGSGKFDFHWWVDWGEDAVIGRENALKLTLPKDGGKTIYIASDTHLDDGYRSEKATQFDYVFFNQKHARDNWYPKTRPIGGDRFHYLPHAADPLVYNHAGKEIAHRKLSMEEEERELEETKEMETLKKYDICFIGHIQEYHKGNGINLPRIDVLDYIFKTFPNFYFGTRTPIDQSKNIFEDAARHFVESKIVLNISVGNDVNMRFFETLMTGSFLLTNRIPELKSIEKYGFIDGKHYAAYETLEDAEELIKYFLQNESEREDIAKLGHEQALKTGTYTSRIDEILKLIGGDNNG